MWHIKNMKTGQFIGHFNLGRTRRAVNEYPDAQQFKSAFAANKVVVERGLDIADWAIVNSDDDLED